MADRSLGVSTPLSTKALPDSAVRGESTSETFAPAETKAAGTCNVSACKGIIADMRTATSTSAKIRTKLGSL